MILYFCLGELIFTEIVVEYYRYAVVEDEARADELVGISVAAVLRKRSRNDRTGMAEPVFLVARTADLERVKVSRNEDLGREPLTEQL